MSDFQSHVTFKQRTEYKTDQPTLVEGLPGHGLVAAIAVDQITRQLNLEQYGTIHSEEFPQITSFNDGRVQDLVRVYRGEDPAVMTLQSDIAIPPFSYQALSQCVLDDLANEFKRAIFLVGAPAQNESQIGDVTGVATTDTVEAELTDIGIPLAEEPGLVGGATGALVNNCYHAEIPAAVLIVHSNPFFPDPTAAQAVIETALEPLVEFDIDTIELEEQADTIEQQLHQVAEQYQQMVQDHQIAPPSSPTPSMYQ
ncbi:proteasome assembly chaperone family protein [Haladaptatus halobius]|uniref:proteasome assembly chaperone family protein n=1 Tax=Haladaptatus halobius TaxID=2884875 RepID=UPI001D0A2265|nr:PAC2 family protein [Haladaptatus halobius]